MYCVDAVKSLDHARVMLWGELGLEMSWEVHVRRRLEGEHVSRELKALRCRTQGLELMYRRYSAVLLL